MFAAVCSFSSCDVEEFPNLNGPTLESAIDGATLADVKLLATGLESITRNDMQFYYWTVSSVGREYYDLRGTDPRYTGELLGAQGAALDNNGFLTTRPFSAPYRIIRNANTLITSVENANASLSGEQENALFGFANTWKGYATLLTLNHQYQNGCRLDVADPDNLGPFVSYEDGLRGAYDLLSTAYTQLNAASADFPFAISGGYTSFGGNAPAEFSKFTAAIMARIALYQGNMDQVKTDLGKSFMDLGGTMDMGAYHVFSAAGGDFRNPLFNVLNTDTYMAAPDWVNNLEADDTRANKVAELASTVTLDGLSGAHQVQIYGSDTDPVGIIRNEELLLIHAEANLGTAGNAEPIAAIDAVRTAAGLPAYSGGTSDAEVMDEIVHQRRYSLFGEGHRWVDLRRLGRLGDIVLDRAGDKVHEQFPRPVTEEE